MCTQMSRRYGGLSEGPYAKLTYVAFSHHIPPSFCPYPVPGTANIVFDVRRIPNTENQCNLSVNTSQNHGNTTVK